jgi:hypothetical protein
VYIYIYIYVNIESSLCLIKSHAMKKYAGMRVYIHVFLTSGLDEGEWLVPSGKYLIEGSVGPRIGLDWSGGCGEHKNLLSISEIKPRILYRPAHSS